MRSCLFHPCKPFPLVRIAFIAVLTLLTSGWSTCTAMVDFNSCEGSMPQPKIASLSPGAVAGDSTSGLRDKVASVHDQKKSAAIACSCRDYLHRIRARIIKSFHSSLCMTPGPRGLPG